MQRRFRFLLPISFLLLLPLLLHAEGNAPMPAEGWAGLLSLGLLFGLKHALDADHLVAIGTIAGENRGIAGAALTGLWWGIGHTLSLLVAGVAVLFLRLEITEATERMLEIGVATMILSLGGRAVLQVLRGEASLRLGRHRHGAIEHLHPHLRSASIEAEESSPRNRTIGVRTLLVGIVHGLAGSAALMLLVLSQISRPELGLLYIVIFGFGSIVGMIAMSTIFWLPFLATTSRCRRFDIGLRLAAGLGSMGFGVAMFLEHL